MLLKYFLFRAGCPPDDFGVRLRPELSRTLIRTLGSAGS